MRGQRRTLRALAVMCHSQFPEVCFLRCPQGLQPRSEVFSEIKKANFNDNGRFVIGTQTFFVGIQEVSIFHGIQEVSARRLRKELIKS